MIFHRIESEGLAHYSYLIGAEHDALVIDPRRDVEVYLKLATRKGYRIRHVLETHRNEDYLIGSLELAGQTGAEVWHADSQWDYKYGQPVQKGKEWKIGSLALRALGTPGHTPGSMSYLLEDKQGVPWMVFTGDTLFAGEVGRVDLLGKDKLKEMAGMLFDSLYNRLLLLGDGVIVCPAHGAGSACGNKISSRLWTTIGLERRLNPRLQYKDRDEFITRIAVGMERPPYFKQMEEWNIKGPPRLMSLPEPQPMSPPEFAERALESAILDTRLQSFGPAHVPGSISIWLGGVPGFAGWFLPYDRPILLVNETDNPMPVIRYLLRIGYDRVDGYLAGGILSWQKAGYDTESTKTVTVTDLCYRLDSGEDTWILDVRSDSELEQVGDIPGAHHIHIKQLLERLDEVPKDHPVFIFCGTGLRSMIAASLLQQQGWQNISVVLGGFEAWVSISCPVRQAIKQSGELLGDKID